MGDSCGAFEVMLFSLYYNIFSI
ncbi:protein of unknown function [Rhodovastum atsumiense]|nr:protein of unknown function [Rhodovastum atsumiense]